MNIEPKLAEEARRLIDLGAEALTAHPDAEVWQRYATDALAAEEMEALRDHLVLCRACRALVLAATGGQAPARDVPSPHAGATFEERRAWKDLQARLRAAEKAEPRAPAVSPAWRWGALAASLLALVAGAESAHLWRVQQSPVAGEAFIELTPDGEERRGLAEGIQVGGQGERGATLLLQVPGLAKGQLVRAEVLDSSGHALWRDEAPAPFEGMYSVHLPARLLRLEGMKIRLSRPGAEGTGASSAFLTYTPGLAGI
ncbi:MAG TPA: hypothetical protein VN783_14410 [Thermoanaerobaculia bacterium]|nr:hypothetical protein [Thermoanaerobaculia bacterium]